MKLFYRATAKHKSYYLHAEGISQNDCNSTSRHDFLLKFSVNQFFLKNLKVPLPNPAKNELGGINKSIFDRINTILQHFIKLN